VTSLRQPVKSFFSSLSSSLNARRSLSPGWPQCTGLRQRVDSESGATGGRTTGGHTAGPGSLALRLLQCHGHGSSWPGPGQELELERHHDVQRSLAGCSDAVAAPRSRFVMVQDKNLNLNVMFNGFRLVDCQFGSPQSAGVTALRLTFQASQASFSSTVT
jgi:hypothetical protein